MLPKEATVVAERLAVFFIIIPNLSGSCGLGWQRPVQSISIKAGMRLKNQLFLQIGPLNTVLSTMYSDDVTYLVVAT